jgi:dihydrofolate reductase
MSAMAKLVYSMITSLDGYISDESGSFDWATPDAEVFEFINDMERSVGTVLYGRRMYETMLYWETFDGSDDDPIENDFADIWRNQDKIVFSTTLAEPSSAKTRIERTFVPEEVLRMKQTSDTDLSIAGPHIASQAIEAGLVDEMHLFIAPVTLGGGASAHPGEALTELELLDVNRFEGGFLHLHYALIV